MNNNADPLLKLILLRHGQTTANANGIIQGQQPHWKLDSTGRQQAESARRQLSGQRFWRCFSSDLDRALETAQIASASLDSPEKEGDHTIRADPRLREFALGVREGRSVALSWEAADAIYKQEAVAGVVDHLPPPPRETPAEVATRMTEFLMALVCEAREEKYGLLSSSGGTLRPKPLAVLLVGHGGCLSIFLNSVMGLAFEGKVENCSITDVLVYENIEGTGSRPRCSFGERVNYAVHFSGERIHSRNGVSHEEGDDATAAILTNTTRKETNQSGQADDTPTVIQKLQKL